MDEPGKLATYPYVILRLRCDPCRRAGQYRIARLGQAFGADIGLDELLVRLTKDCPWQLARDPRKYEPRCLAYLPDIEGRPRPPDMPPGAAKLRVVKGGKS
ncbi:hypothetical protein E8L99_16485 [Phreatobacter aquaticus]|uniref:Uncharacterized protein n=1 Tax=Phreatobacter aquaticus TaxID=2570229 RepID=A0A4D7QNQ4_9HYPH|nr:hypothetical protein [Phreatobacter aquaticus]QCK87239.1 hypothetical protein E8L99_16485 [Phreatobacter aquaticus]